MQQASARWAPCPPQASAVGSTLRAQLQLAPQTACLSVCPGASRLELVEKDSCGWQHKTQPRLHAQAGAAAVRCQQAAAAGAHGGRAARRGRAVQRGRRPAVHPPGRCCPSPPAWQRMPLCSCCLPSLATWGAAIPQGGRDCGDHVRGVPPGMDFRYRDPDRGFQRASVKGVLGRLVELKDAQHATALEVAAGGKLYQVLHGALLCHAVRRLPGVTDQAALCCGAAAQQPAASGNCGRLQVVVDTERTAQALLARGQLRTRVTIIPLSKACPAHSDCLRPPASCRGSPAQRSCARAGQQQSGVRRRMRGCPAAGAGRGAPGAGPGGLRACRRPGGAVRIWQRLCVPGVPGPGLS